MRRIAVINQKGGVGKTTTTVNLGAAFARLGRRVLLCDLDPQCNLTVHVDAEPKSGEPSIYELLQGKATLAEAVKPTGYKRLDVLPASVDLAGCELELATEVGRETILRRVFEADEAARGPHWDFVFVDCPPSLGLLSLNSLVACDEIFVPIQAEFFALQGLGKLLEVVELVQTRLNPRLRISGMVSCRYDPSTNLSRQVIEEVRNYFGDILLNTVIRRNVKLAEAPSHGRTIFGYAPDSRGAEDYLALAFEVLGDAAGEVVDDADELPPVEIPSPEPSGGPPETAPREPTPAATPVATPAATPATTPATTPAATLGETAAPSAAEQSAPGDSTTVDSGSTSGPAAGATNGHSSAAQETASGEARAPSVPPADDCADETGRASTRQAAG